MKALFTGKLYLDLEISKNAQFWAYLCVVPKLENFRKDIRNTLKVLKCDAGEDHLGCSREKWRLVITTEPQEGKEYPMNSKK